MVFVLDKNKTPLNMCHEARARTLLKNGKASIYRRQPFTIILHTEVQEPPKKECRIKYDYGSRHTGIAILKGDRVMWLAQLHHRTGIKERLDKRKGYRIRRRNANLRYRKARFSNRKRRENWLPPSIQSRVDSITAMTDRLMRLVPVGDISYENVRFDTQLMQDETIHGIEYQQGELYGYEVREYLLEKFGHKCAYCGKEHVPLEVEHIIPKSRGGSNRISNLTIACRDCNQEKGTLTASEYGHPEVQEMAKEPLRDAILVTATRWAVYKSLCSYGVSVECGSGGRTKHNRTKIGLPKEHYYDACCIGASTPNSLHFCTNQVLNIHATGRGQHQRTNPDASGFPRGYLPRQKSFFGFQTGDIVKADVPKGKNKGVYYGAVACRTSGNFDIKTADGRKQGISYKYVSLIQKKDGYRYETTERSATSYPCLKAGVSVANVW